MGCAESKEACAKKPLHPVQVVEDDGGVRPYVPDAACQRTYDARVELARQCGVRQGIFAPDTSSTNRSASQRNGAVAHRGKGQPAPTPPPKTVLVYQCQPLPDLPTCVNKGMYSQVFLADMTLISGKLSDVRPRHSRVARNNTAAATVNDNDASVTVRHYLIAMKEVLLRRGNAGATALNLIEAEVRQWSRLCAYCPRLLKFIQMESVLSNQSSLPVIGASFHNYKHRPMSGNGEDDDDDEERGPLASRVSSFLGGNKRSPNASSTLQQRNQKEPPARLRFYMEYARYGNLHSFQGKEMMSLFNKSYLHELTARMYIREVLLLVLHLHECGALQYDVNASNIFISRPMRAVYHTYFPVYISDVPYGAFTQIPPARISEAISRQDPMRFDLGGMHARSVYSNDDAGSHFVNLSMLVQMTGEDPQLASLHARSPTAAHHADSFRSCHSPVSPGVPHGGLSSTINDGPYPISPLLHSAASPNMFAKAGITMDRGVEEGKWQNEAYHAYAQEHGYEDGVTLPAPSPHDGLEGLLDADLVVQANDTMCANRMKLYPLENAVYGGISVVCPNRFPIQEELEAMERERATAPFPNTSFTIMDRRLHHGTFPPPLLCPPTAEVGNEPVSESRGRLPPNMNEDAANFLQQPTFSTRQPIIKLDRMAMIRRAMAIEDGCVGPEYVPIHKYVSVLHAAPETIFHRTFSEASDIYVCAMTFIELVTPKGEFMRECLPTDLQKPRTRREKELFDGKVEENVRAWYRDRMEQLERMPSTPPHATNFYDSSAPPSLSPIAVALPTQLSDECKRMLTWCLQIDPMARPTAGDVLRHKYFVFGDWMIPPASGKSKEVLPEKPWGGAVDVELAARSLGLRPCA